MRVVIISKRRMKIRKALGYDHWCIGYDVLNRLAGTSFKAKPDTVAYQIEDGFYKWGVPKHFIGKVIK